MGTVIAVPEVRARFNRVEPGKPAGNFHTHEASEVAWVVDIDGARLAQVAARFPDVQVGTDGDTLVLCSDADVPASVARWVDDDAGQVPASAVKELVLDLQNLR